jgi:hypothetical protein
MVMIHILFITCPLFLMGMLIGAAFPDSLTGYS